MKSTPGGSSSRPETQVTVISATAVRSRTLAPSAIPSRTMSFGFMRSVRVTSAYFGEDLSPTLVPWSAERPGMRMNRSDVKFLPAPRPSGGVAARLRRAGTATAASPPHGLRAARPLLREGVLGGVALAHHVVGRRQPLDGALERLFGRAVVVVVDLLVVARLPVDENPDHQRQVVGLPAGDGAVGDTVHHGFRDRGLRGTEHLDSLARALDRDLVEHDGVRLRRYVGREHCEQPVVPRGLRRQPLRECRADWAVLRTDHQVDVGNLVAITDQRFTDHNAGFEHWRPPV